MQAKENGVVKLWTNTNTENPLTNATALWSIDKEMAKLKEEG
jgi:hypothetical protein